MEKSSQGMEQRTGGRGSFDLDGTAGDDIVANDSNYEIQLERRVAA